jgi:hypothetical protein
MKNNILYTFSILTILLSCKQTNAELANENTLKTVTMKKDEKAKSDFKSSLRPNENIEKNKKYEDIVIFMGIDNNGDYPLLIVKKNGNTVSLIFSDLEADNFSKTASYEQGDIIRIKWKVDTAEVAGDDEKPYLTEFLLTSKKIKDGKLSQFNKIHQNPFRVQYIEGDFSLDFLKSIDKKVRYYLSNTKEPLLLLELKDPNSNLAYSLEEQDRDGTKYIAVGLFTTLENHQSILHWLYINMATDELYDYDLPNDKLIKLN